MRVSGWMRGALAMLGVAGVLAVSACGDGTTPEPSSSASATSDASTLAPESSSESAEPMEATPDHPAQNLVPPELPEEATEFTEEGFKAFVEHWIEVRNYAVAAGDARPLESISGADCDRCAADIEAAHLVDRAKGQQWIVGGEIEADEFFAQFNDDRNLKQEAFLTIVQSSGDTYGPDGLTSSGQKIIPARTIQFGINAEYDGKSWKLIAMTEVA